MRWRHRPCLCFGGGCLFSLSFVGVGLCLGRRLSAARFRDFWRDPALVLVFSGLTAWDTQRLKNEYIYFAMDGAIAQRSAILGALSLYLDFVNMFTVLLQLLGQRDD